MSRTGGGKEVLTTAAVAVGVGVGVAALAGLGLAGAALGAGTLLAANSSFAQRAKPPLQPADVRRDEQGCIENWTQLLKAVQHGGIAPELRAELWPLLLGVFRWDSSQHARNAELERLRRLYVKLVLVCRELDAQLQALRSSGSAGSAAANGSGGGFAMELGAAESAASSARSEAGSTAAGAATAPPLPGNLAAFAEAHRIIVMDAVRTDLRRSSAEAQPGGPVGGPAASSGQPALTVLPVAVGDGLPELMLVSPPDPPPPAASSEAELAAAAADPAAAAELGRHLPRWCSVLARDTLWGAAHLDEPTRAQMLRLVNLLSAYAVHDPETGYCQGMSDLASIFVQLFEDDALAFACFERLMRSARRNFRHDETGIRHQLQQIARVLRDTDPQLYSKLQQLGAEDCMFAYRMVVVMLRRELPPAACCTLWEMQWAHEAAEAEAEGSRRHAGEPPLRTASSESQELGPSGGSSSTSHSTAAAAAVAASAAEGAALAAGLRSTVQGLSEATASARAAAAAAADGQAGTQQQGGQIAKVLSRPGSGRERALAGTGSGSTALGEAPPPEFVLQFIAAVVRSQRARVLLECREHDDVLRLFSSLNIQFWLAVAQARKQHRAYRMQLGRGSSAGAGVAAGPQA
ncbi:hypothetical protein ABPG77_002372 [Micractinium sp. CCAP 211/92]